MGIMGIMGISESHVLSRILNTSIPHAIGWKQEQQTTENTAMDKLSGQYCRRRTVCLVAWWFMQ